MIIKPVNMVINMTHMKVPYVPYMLLVYHLVACVGVYAYLILRDAKKIFTREVSNFIQEVKIAGGLTPPETVCASLVLTFIY